MGTGEGEWDSRMAGQHWQGLQEEWEEVGNNRSKWIEERVNLGAGCVCVYKDNP